MAILAGDDPEAIAAAARTLAAGQLVAFPTETVYGLGARADDDAAVARIFQAKGRPADHPLIVHVPDVAAAMRFAAAWPACARALAERFWPGPVTLIVPRRADVAAAAAGGLPTIGLRCPDHPVARLLLRACAELGVGGLAAPSANRFGRVSPSRAAHVAAEFGPALPVLDGGDCREGIESAIVDCSRDEPYLLRPGTVARGALEAALGRRLRDPDRASPRVSGSLVSHYAPRARVRLVGTAELAATGERGVGVGVYSRRQPPGVGRHWRAMPDNPAAVARDLYAVLRDLDDLGVGEIWVEACPPEPAWDAVRDRLTRAAAAQPHPPTR
jgi:L-threonylcarbamoyladenylate synthase